MAKILTFEIAEDEYNDFKDFLEKAVIEMRESRAKMQDDQIEIDRLKEETRIVATETQKVLAELEATWLKAA